MKSYILIAFLIVSGMAISQNKPEDKMTTTKTKTTKIDNGNEVKTQKTKIVTTKKQVVITDPRDKKAIDADRIFPPIKVSETIMVDNDNDPFFEEVLKVEYFDDEEQRYAFKKSENGFTFNLLKNDKENLMGNAVKSNYNPYYFVNYNNKTGIGYFDENNRFIVEYFNKKDNRSHIKVFDNVAF